MGILNYIKNKNLMVIGLGMTGISVIKNIAGVSGSILAIDDNPNKRISNEIKKFKNLNILLGKESRDSQLLDEIDLIITSPGIPGNHYMIKKANIANIPIWSELELGWSILDKGEKRNTVAVTGTNGKTTAVNLIGKILKDGGKKIIICGNVGNPLINTIDKRNYIRVIEVSSFQLERINSFNPHISIILNVTSDHIDRHGSIEKYLELKFNILKYQTNENYTLLNCDDENIQLKINKKRNKIKPEIIRYGIREKKDLSIWYKNGVINYDFRDFKGGISIEEIPLKGEHNISNIMPCIFAAKIFKIKDESIKTSLRNFRPLGHRLEYVGEFNNIKVFNDSKSTNPDSTIAALKNFTKDVTLILGGRDKDMDFSELFKVLDKKVKKLILIGESKEKLFNYIKEKKYSFNIFKVESLEEAVRIGLRETPKGGIFLLSPACASMDMFKDYKHRGNEFKKLIKQKGK